MSRTTHKRSLNIWLSKTSSDGTVITFNNHGQNEFIYDGITYPAWSNSDLATKTLDEFNTRLNAFKLYIYNLYLESEPSLYENIYWDNSRISVLIEDPVVSDPSAENIYIDSFNLASSCTNDNIIEYGFVLAIGSPPSISDNIIKQSTSIIGTGGAFNYAFTELSANTNYYAKAYVIDNTHTVFYSNNVIITTLSSDISVTTDSTTVSGSNCTITSGFGISARGIFYGTDPTLTTFSRIDVNNLMQPNYGTASYVISGLAIGTYYVKAYVLKDGVNYFGSILSFNIE